MELTTLIKEAYEQWRVYFSLCGAFRDAHGDGFLVKKETGLNARLQIIVPAGELTFYGDYAAHKETSFEGWQPEHVVFYSRDRLTALTVNDEGVTVEKQTARVSDTNKNFRGLYVMYAPDGMPREVRAYPTDSLVLYYDISGGVARRTEISSSGKHAKSQDEIAAHLSGLKIEAPETFGVRDLVAGLAMRINGRRQRFPAVPASIDRTYVDGFLRQR